MFDNSISDEDFENLDDNTVMQEIDSQVDALYSQPQEQYQGQYREPENNIDPSGSYEQQQEYTQQVDPNVYKETYDKLFSPFKADGKEFQIRDINEAISLMQKGVDYTKKQQALKPRLIEMRTLEENGMLGSNMDYAIDLYHGNPKALAKLIKDKGIDINTLMPQQQDDGFGNVTPVEESPYVPVSHRISDERFAFQNAIDDLKRTSDYDKVNEAIGKFDDASKQEFFKDPSKLRDLAGHINSGFFDKIQSELDHLRAVDSNEIHGLSDFDAYTKIGNEMLRRQYQAQMQQQPPQYAQAPQPQYYAPQQQNYYNETSQPMIYAQQQQNIQQRKAGVTPIRPSNLSNRPGVSYDPLTCSDEEFEKINLDELLMRYR